MTFIREVNISVGRARFTAGAEMCRVDLSVDSSEIVSGMLNFSLLSLQFNQLFSSIALFRWTVSSF